ncbi:MAG: nuclear transport factor 2 family protein [Solirubrobacteraceae bacterium]|nr:nuclear transport factor 2 family protein [Solirubrobacteraceae bacterium]
MTADRDSLLRSEHELQRAQLASDTDALALLLHEDLRFIGPDAGVHGRAADLAAHAAGDVVFRSSNALEIEARVFGATGLSIALIELEVEVGGETVRGAYRYTRTWLHEDGRWQIVGGAVVAVPA